MRNWLAMPAIVGGSGETTNWRGERGAHARIAGPLSTHSCRERTGSFRPIPAIRPVCVSSDSGHWRTGRKSLISGYLGNGGQIYLKLFFKCLLVALVLLIALSIATALIPGSDKWPEFINFGVILLISFAFIAYLRRKYGEDRRT